MIARFLAMTNRPAFIELRRDHQKRMRKMPSKLTPIPMDEWPTQQHERPPFAAWHSREYLVQAYQDNGHVRLSVNRTHLTNQGDWQDGVTWDELMKVKAEVGYGDAWAVELFPPSERVVNVANIRHLWIVPQPAFAWNKNQDEEPGTASKDHAANLAINLEHLIDNVEPPPPANCSCHMTPPCGDCFDHGALREALADAKTALLDYKGGEA